MTFRKKQLIALAITIAATLGIAAAVEASSDNKHPKQLHWAFDGMTGTLDRQAAQRGFKVYKEVCAACHGMQRIAYRNLKEIGFSEGEVKTLAAEAQVTDGPNDAGEMYQRPGVPADKLVPPYPNEKAARAANGGAYPPDLSLMIKARKDGANYVYSLLTGYEAAPAEVVLGANMHYNPYFPGHQIAMPAPLMSDGQVTFDDGTAATVDQMSRDVVTFMQWAAEPEMEARKQMGIKVLIFLGVMSVLSYLAMRRVWARIEH